MSSFGKSCILVLALLAFACKKTVTYDGTIYSKHEVPIPNQAIEFHYGIGGKDQTEGFYTALTDHAGHFVFHKKIRSNQSIQEIVIRSDSLPAGSVYSAKTGGVNSSREMRIVLN